MVALKDFDTMKTTTLDLLESIEYPQTIRTYLGMSELGHPCNRYLWYRFRWCFFDKVSARMERLFDRGKREEAVVIENLRRIGYTVEGEQDEFVHAFGHCKGHWDGKVLGVIEAPKSWHVLEIKTMNDKYFKQLTKSNVKVAKPIYYGQSQLYMRKSGLKRTLFIAVNKNDDSTYVERIRIDEAYADDLLHKALEIILAPIPPIKVYKPTWYECKWCPAAQVCHYNANPPVTCRTCVASNPDNKGQWLCNETVLTKQMQLNACKDYRLML